MEKAIGFHSSLQLLKSFEGMRYYAFKVAKQERAVKFRAHKFCTNNLKTSVWHALLANMQRRKQKRIAFGEARRQRERTIRQNSLFKLMRVAVYWRQKQAKSDSNVEMRRAFFKWYEMHSRERERHGVELLKLPMNTSSSMQMPFLNKSRTDLYSVQKEIAIKTKE